MILRRLATLLLCLTLLLTLGARAEAGQVCAWLDEKTKAHNEHVFALWLSATDRLDFIYKIGGTGVTAEGFSAHSPSSGTFSLNAGKPERAWGFGTTVPTPARIDITVEFHQQPGDIFSDAPSPLIAAFAFARTVPDGEKKAPATLGAKQCSTIS